MLELLLVHISIIILAYLGAFQHAFQAAKIVDLGGHCHIIGGRSEVDEMVLSLILIPMYIDTRMLKISRPVLAYFLFLRWPDLAYFFLKLGVCRIGVKTSRLSFTTLWYYT